MVFAKYFFSSDDGFKKYPKRAYIELRGIFMYFFKVLIAFINMVPGAGLEPARYC